jgi:hypothetical protein
MMEPLNNEGNDSFLIPFVMFANLKSMAFRAAVLVLADLATATINSAFVILFSPSSWLGLEVVLNNGVLFMKDGFLTAAEISSAVAFLPTLDLVAEYEYTPAVVANLTADRILTLLTEPLPAGFFMVRKGRDI